MTRPGVRIVHRNLTRLEFTLKSPILKVNHSLKKTTLYLNDSNPISIG